MDKIGLRQVLPDVFADNPPVGSEIWRRDVTFDKGRVYLVEAASGSGKSSFCGYLYGYRRDYSGTILFDDRDIRELSVGEWSGLRCRSLAMMFQGLRLFPELSAVDNVRLKNNLTGRRSEAEIAWLFEALGIAEKRETSVSKLSFGQQQRADIFSLLSLQHASQARPLQKSALHSFRDILFFKINQAFIQNIFFYMERCVINNHLIFCKNSMAKIVVISGKALYLHLKISHTGH